MLLPVAEVLTEARSAKAPGRTVFNALMQRVANGDVHGILCWKLDRLARNPIDGAAVIWAIRQHHLAIITPTSTFRQEDNNTILMYIEFGMAQKYIDDLAKNVKRGMQAKAARGWLPLMAPVGYLNTGPVAHGPRTIIKDPERFPVVRRMWDLMLTGRYTPPRILAMATNDWGFRVRGTPKRAPKPLARSTLYALFTNPFYAGLLQFGGQLYQGQHAPMVTLEEYDRVQRLLGRHRTPRAQRHTFAFTGLIRCGACGAMITAEAKRKRQQNGTLHHYVYYHCAQRSHGARCRQPSIEQRALEQQMAAYLATIQISEAFKDWAIRVLRKVHDQDVMAHQDRVAAQRRAYDACVQQLENLLRLKLSPANMDGSLLTDAEYGSHKSRLLGEKARLEAQLRDVERRGETWLDTAEHTFLFACHAQEWFAHGTYDDKRQMLMAVGSNLVLTDKKLGIEATKPFVVLAEGLKTLAGAHTPFEPPEHGFTAPQKKQFGAQNVDWWSIVDDVRTACRAYGSIAALRTLIERLVPTMMRVL